MKTGDSLKVSPNKKHQKNFIIIAPPQKTKKKYCQKFKSIFLCVKNATFKHNLVLRNESRGRKTKLPFPGKKLIHLVTVSLFPLGGKS